ncbi:hypothetical protein RRG08_000759 [Elysia crispata]|uniref:Uncharacterized protein n=1 Tax=Elysia crispata TaxID=231223 RepID=A0AAE0YKN9_9GAST|nr:hypothetical protein RRG08_000759 [Elysia crispata]
MTREVCDSSVGSYVKQPSSTESPPSTCEILRVQFSRASVQSHGRVSWTRPPWPSRPPPSRLPRHLLRPWPSRGLQCLPMQKIHKA